MPRSGGRAFADLEAIVWEADPVAQLFTAVTGAAAELTGHAPGVWTAAPDFAAALIYPEDRGDALAAFDEAIVSAERRHVEYRVVRPTAAWYGFTTPFSRRPATARACAGSCSTSPSRSWPSGGSW